MSLSKRAFREDQYSEWHILRTGATFAGIFYTFLMGNKSVQETHTTIYWVTWVWTKIGKVKAILHVSNVQKCLSEFSTFIVPLDEILYKDLDIIPSSICWCRQNRSKDGRASLTNASEIIFTRVPETVRHLKLKKRLVKPVHYVT